MNIGSITRHLAFPLALAGVVLAVGPPAAQAAFPGKNGRIAFSREVRAPSGSEYETESLVLQTVSPTGRGRRTLATCPAGRCLDSQPAWSPDGKSLLFHYLSADGTGGIGAVGAGGFGLRRLQLLTLQDSQPAWSPDGGSCAFAGIGGPTLSSPAGIYTARADGSVIRRVTPPGRRAGEPTWSRRGKIAFTSGDANPDVYVVNPDGSSLRRLTRRGGYQPDWSPHGKLLAFGREVTGRAQYIYVVRSDGRRLRRLARGREPAWSPDGKWIAFNRNADDIYVIRTNGSGLRRIANGSDGTVRKIVTYAEPSWQPRP